MQIQKLLWAYGYFIDLHYRHRYKTNYNYILNSRITLLFPNFNAMAMAWAFMIWNLSRAETYFRELSLQEFVRVNRIKWYYMNVIFNSITTGSLHSRCIACNNVGVIHLIDVILITVSHSTSTFADLVTEINYIGNCSFMKFKISTTYNRYCISIIHIHNIYLFFEESITLTTFSWRFMYACWHMI